MTLKAEIAVKALIRRAQSGGAFAAVTGRGDPDFGTMLVKVARLDGTAHIHRPALDLSGDQVWTQPLGEAPKPEPEVDAYIAKSRDRDPDIWVIEIEDRFGRAFLA